MDAVDLWLGKLSCTSREDDLATVYKWVKEGEINAEVFADLIAAMHADEIAFEEEFNLALAVCDVAAEFIFCDDESHHDEHFEELADLVSIWMETQVDDGTPSPKKDMN